jgi:ribose/xylose/arabinose/galactoside ABC-type transport system permease subunit
VGGVLNRVVSFGGRRLVGTTELQLLVVLLILVAAFSLTYHQFFSVDNAQNMARQGAILLVVATGEAFALVVGGFDISVGANMGFAGTVAALVMVQYNLAIGILAGLAAAALAGFANGVLIARLGVSPFVATLAMLTFLTGLANQVSSGASVSGLPASFGWFGANDVGPIPTTIIIAAIVLVCVWFVLNRLRIGLYIYAIGGGRTTSLLSGVPVARYEIFAYTACGLLAGVAGIMLSSRVSVGQASLGTGYELLAIATAVIGGVSIGGGVGRLLGVVLGVAVLTSLTTGMDIAGISQFVQQMITGGVLVAAVLFNRGGTTLTRMRQVLRLRGSR